MIDAQEKKRLSDKSTALMKIAVAGVIGELQRKHATPKPGDGDAVRIAIVVAVGGIDTPDASLTFALLPSSLVGDAHDETVAFLEDAIAVARIAETFEVNVGGGG